MTHPLRSFTASLLLATAFMTTSCEKDDAAPAAPAPFEITRAEAEAYFKPGAPSVPTFGVNLAATPIAVPAGGPNNAWNFSALAEASQAPAAALITPPPNTAFPTATYAFRGRYGITLGAFGASVPATYYWELNNTGLFQLGWRTDSSFTLILPPTSPGTVSFAAQNLAGEAGTRRQLMRFPGRLNDTLNTTLVQPLNFVLDIPAMGLNMVPGQIRTSQNTRIHIMGAGTVNLKGHGVKRALLVQETLRITDQYLLGGAPAPAALLAGLGLTQNSSVTDISYIMYAEGLGIVATLRANATNTLITSAFVAKK